MSVRSSTELSLMDQPLVQTPAKAEATEAKTLKEKVKAGFENFKAKAGDLATKVFTPAVERDEDAAKRFCGCTKLVDAAKKIYTPVERLQPKTEYVPVDKDYEGPSVLIRTCEGDDETLIEVQADKNGNPIEKMALSQRPLQLLAFNDKIGCAVARQIVNVLGCLGAPGLVAAIVIGAIARAAIFVAAPVVETLLAIAAAAIALVITIAAVVTSPIWTPATLPFIGYKFIKQDQKIAELDKQLNPKPPVRFEQIVDEYGNKITQVSQDNRGGVQYVGFDSDLLDFSDLNGSNDGFGFDDNQQ